MADGVAALLVAAAVLIVTPGPDTAVAIRNTLVGGRRSGVLTALGVAAGQTTWTVATVAGLATLLLASEPVFRSVKLVGAAYLAFLGARALHGALRTRPYTNGAAGAAVAREELPPAAALREGLISNLTNPKMAAFFPALLPQFAPAGGAAVPVSLLLGLTFSLMTLAWLSGYALAVAKAGDLLRRRRVRRLLDGMTGAVLVVLGLRLATEPR